MKRGFAAFAIFILVLAAAAFAFYKFFLPDYVADKIVRALQERGLSEVSLEVARVSPSHAVLQNLRIGEQSRLFIREILVTYDRAALAGNRVHAIQLQGAEFSLAIANGKINWGPLANYKRAGAMVVPFDSLSLNAATLQLEWEGHHLTIPFAAQLKNLRDDSLALDLDAKLARGGDLHLQALCSIDSLHGAFDFRVDHLAAGLLQQAQKTYFPETALTIGGWLDATAHVYYEGAKWRSRIMLDGDSLLMEYQAPSPDHRINVSRIETGLALKSDSLSVVNWQALVNGAPVAINATVNLTTRMSAGNFAITRIPASALRQIVKAFASGGVPEFLGASSAHGEYSFDGEEVAAHLLLNSKNFSARPTLASHELLASARAVEFDANLLLKNLNFKKSRISKSPSVQLLDFEARVHGMDILAEELGLALDSITARLPVNWQKQEMQKGAFSGARARWRELELLTPAGDLQWKNGRVDLAASAQFLENARLDLSGWVDRSQDEMAAEFWAHAPAFNLHDSGALVAFLPKLRDHTLSGIFELDANMKIAGNNFNPQVRLNVQNMDWHSKLTEARVADIAGILTINNLDPLTSAGGQRFTFDSAAFGSLEIAQGEVSFAIANLDSVLIDSISCSWAGGRLASSNIVLKPSSARIDFVLHAEGLDLQAILDFVEYRGVKGQGKIYGDLPITMHWGEKRRLSFGDGYLEARPQAGVLQLTKENAQALLGIQKEIDPKNASLEDQVSLMVINALQDMAYTNLRVEFKNEAGRGLMTYVRAQGYGPRRDQENQIPIGGFNVNINHLDDLLNSMIWPQLGAEKIKLD